MWQFAPSSDPADSYMSPVCTTCRLHTGISPVASLINGSLQDGLAAISPTANIIISSISALIVWISCTVEI